MRALAALLLLLAAGPALAHGGAELAHSMQAAGPGGNPGWHPGWHPGGNPEWTFDPWVVTPLALAAGLYGAGMVRLRSRRGRLLLRRRSAAFAAGWLALAGALVTPLHWLGERLFSVHMVEHEIVMAVAAPLLAAARPFGPSLWSLPGAGRALSGRIARAAPVRRGWRWLTAPRTATLLHGVALWLWHLPVLLDATVGDAGIHRLQHLSFLGSALLFWWAMLWRADHGAAAAHLFVTMLHMSVLGALIALSPRLLYPVQTAGAPRWGLTPLEDQQLAGFLMWVPGCAVYAAAALLFVALWIGRSSAAGRGRHAPRRP